MISEYFYATRTFCTRRWIHTPFLTYYVRVTLAMRHHILLTIGANTYITNADITFVSNAQRGRCDMYVVQ